MTTREKIAANLRRITGESKMNYKMYHPKHDSWLIEARVRGVYVCGAGRTLYQATQQAVQILSKITTEGKNNVS